MVRASTPGGAEARVWRKADSTPTGVEAVTDSVIDPQTLYDRRRLSGRASATRRSEEHTSELQSLMRISYAVFCLTKQINQAQHHYRTLTYKTATNAHPLHTST